MEGPATPPHDGAVSGEASQRLRRQPSYVVDSECQTGIGRCRTASAASVLQASGFRSDVTVFRLNARRRPKTGSESAFSRKTAEHVYRIEAAHNPEVAGSNPAPATAKGAGNGAFRFSGVRSCIPTSLLLPAAAHG